MPKMIAERDEALADLYDQADQFARDSRMFLENVTPQLERLLKIAYARGFSSGWSNRRAR